MLSFQTIDPNTLELLKTLAQAPILSNMRLVGGTALALQYGHRRSVDLDFFGQTTESVEELSEALKEYTGGLTLLSASKTIYVVVKGQTIRWTEFGEDGLIFDGDELRSSLPSSFIFVDSEPYLRLSRGTGCDCENNIIWHM